jgi:hypothetical protein
VLLFLIVDVSVVVLICLPYLLRLLGGGGGLAYEHGPSRPNQNQKEGIDRREKKESRAEERVERKVRVTKRKMLTSRKS